MFVDGILCIKNWLFEGKEEKPEWLRGTRCLFCNSGGVTICVLDQLPTLSCEMFDANAEIVLERNFFQRVLN